MFLFLFCAIRNLFLLFPHSVAGEVFPGRCQPLLSFPSALWPRILFGGAHSQIHFSWAAGWICVLLSHRNSRMFCKSFSLLQLGLCTVPESDVWDLLFTTFKNWLKHESSYWEVGTPLSPSLNLLFKSLLLKFLKIIALQYFPSLTFQFRIQKKWFSEVFSTS